MINLHPDIQLKLLDLANAITCKAVRKWSPYLDCYKDEVVSEAMVSVVKALRKYLGQINDTTWTPAMFQYSYGLLISAMKTQRFLPSPNTLFAYTNAGDVIDFQDQEGRIKHVFS